ncbi:MAG: hypothetical protein HY292_08025 [Planctomycetes bacterium]|nr:hypothetical protein [Planctomycetota bacterium]
MRAPSRWTVAGVVLVVDVVLLHSVSASPPVGSQSRALASAFLAFPILAIVAPACAASSARAALALTGSISIVHSVAVALRGAPLPATLAVFADSLGFGLLALAIVTFLVDVGALRAVAATAGSLVALGIVAAPFVAGPILDHPSMAPVRRDVGASIVAINPFAGVASAFRFDWLRADRMYVLSEIGSDPYHYPNALVLAAMLGSAGATLWLAGRAIASASVRRT